MQQLKDERARLVSGALPPRNLTVIPAGSSSGRGGEGKVGEEERPTPRGSAGLSAASEPVPSPWRAGGGGTYGGGNTMEVEEDEAMDRVLMQQMLAKSLRQGKAGEAPLKTKAMRELEELEKARVSWYFFLCLPRCLLSVSSYLPT